MIEANELPRDRRWIAVILIVAPLLSVFAMAHHPAHLNDPGLVRWVHGLLSVLGIVVAIALFTLFDPRRSATTLAGSLFFACGLGAGLGAATLDGFVQPALYVHHLNNSAASELAWALNQALALEGAVAIGIAYACWSVELIRERRRIVGSASLLIGVGTALALISGLVDMKLHGAMVVYMSQWMWLVILGTSVLQRGRPTEPELT